MIAGLCLRPDAALFDYEATCVDVIDRKANTCLECHSNKAEFCDACHNYLAVSPFCWDCHVESKEVQ